MIYHAGTTVRSAVVDLGSNSVRLVVFEGTGRNPAAIFNERAVLRLGRGLQTTGRLNEEGVAAALTVMHRYNAIARAMGCEVLEVLATAAVRDASNGPAFVAGLRERMPGVVIKILSGEEEAAFSAAGVLCGIPQAGGILADIGGGSLEVVRLADGRPGQAQTLPLGVIRLADRAEGDPVRARALAEADLATVPWLFQYPGRDLYLVGGAWRALARIHMAQTGYPLAIVHHYTIGRDDARDMTGIIGSANRRMLERLPVRRDGGWTICPTPPSCCAGCCGRPGRAAWCSAPTAFARAGTCPAFPQKPRRKTRFWPRGRELGERTGRDPDMPAALLDWTADLFANETPDAARMRKAACMLSDVGAHDHPEYRAEQSFYRVLRQPGVALDHAGRAFLAMMIAVRYEADPASAFLTTARGLLDEPMFARAQILGNALRLAYTLSAGTPDLLRGTSTDSVWAEAPPSAVQERRGVPR